MIKLSLHSMVKLMLIVSLGIKLTEKLQTGYSHRRHD